MSTPSSSSTIPPPPAPPKGAYVPAQTSDLRSPCPVVNSLANHGYLPRSGRSVLKQDFTTALAELGLSSTVASLLTNAVYLERQPTPSTPPSILSKLYNAVTNPYSLLSRFAVRPPGQVNSQGEPCLDLNQLSLHGAVEHDVSMSRNDLAQGDNSSRQPELIAEMLAASKDGERLTVAEMAEYRRGRIEERLRNGNPKGERDGEVVYGKTEHRIACGEIALLSAVFGDDRGEGVRCADVRALFGEERLPVEEGWKRRWWRVGLVELLFAGRRVRKLVGWEAGD